MDKKELILQEIRRVARTIAPEPLTRNNFKKESKIPESTLIYHFGTFNRAIEAAGFEPNPPSITIKDKKLSEEELLEEIGELWRRFGHRPTQSLMNSEGKFSTRPYQKRWGKFSAAVNYYISKFGKPILSEDQIDKAEKQYIKEKPMIIPSTIKPKVTAEKKKGIIYGEPIDFRGLRYGPVNEQGVVYLFGMISRELGFLIESIRTDFPDCEGKRCLNQEGTKWQHIRIEFEYKSSNFFEHGHDPNECDLIVCWIHDWADAPIEVLELKSALNLLSRE
jgi:hypothetical protein